MFSQMASRASHLAGKPLTFLIAVGVVLVWAISGPFFGFSDTWQLVINTSTTIVTFLMVFLIQNTQNRDTLALQLKLAELIIAMQGAKNNIATAEDLSEEDLETAARELPQARGGDARSSRAPPWQPSSRKRAEPCGSAYGCTSSVNQSVGNSWPRPPSLALRMTAAPTAAN